jgi:serine/threonine protein kinase
MESKIMATTEIERWFKSRKYAQVNGCRIRPLPHPMFGQEPLIIQKGQAQAISMAGNDGSKWMLKKFHPSKTIERSYLMSVPALLPRIDGFIAGTRRQLLTPEKLVRAPQCYYAADLADFLNDTILMPRIEGIAWSALADDVRDGQVFLSKVQRIALCRKLIELLLALEGNNCCHRDFSSGNVFIDLTSLTIYLIDFDSLYHPGLTMPKTTTCGTIGYSPPFAWQAGVLDPRRTWCPHADRYSAAIMIAEFCILDKGAPLTADGGMFDQNGLCRRAGPGLETARNVLITYWPNVAELFEATINSKDFESCPSPKDWLDAIDKNPQKSLHLAQIEDVPDGYFDEFLKRAKRHSALIQPAPKLSEIPEFKIGTLLCSSNATTLPPNPWN